MNIVFRTDASQTIGTGHVMRCLTLAGALKEKGADITFISREHNGNLCDLIENYGFRLARLPVSCDGFALGSTPVHASWLGESWQKDAEQTKSIIDELGKKPDWLIVDHYALDEQWEKALRPFVDRIMVIDDLADRRHDCDLLLDQNMVMNMEHRFSGYVPEKCTLLLGPKYALLQPIYAELHHRIPPREGPIRHILIYFGGADNDNLTGRALNAFLNLKRDDITVDVVISSDSPHAQTIQHQVTGQANICVHSNLPSLAPLLAKADLAIGAGGATSWERLCLGLPALVITLAENQRQIAHSLHQKSLIRWLGHKDEVDEQVVQRELKHLLENDLDPEWGKNCRSIVDGMGTKRVSTILLANSETPIKIRHACISDEALLLEWANDPVTRRNAFSTEAISAETHHKWFCNRLRNVDGCRLYIAETEDGIPIGQVRFEKNDIDWEIHYAIAPNFRGLGLGYPMLEAALSRMRSNNQNIKIFGKVKESNLPSQKIFNKLGFQSTFDKQNKIFVYHQDTKI
jgi:UDP-2,4-diacetamido-2,4,6-trideoxy-beta-L-altropyranose hydrolase